MNGWYGMGGGHYGYEHQKVAPPENFRDLFRFLKELMGGLFGRLWYIFVLVWKTDPFILFLMMFIAVFDGVMPPIGTVISANVINELGYVIKARAGAGEGYTPGAFIGSAVLSMLIILFVYRITNRVVQRVSNAIIRIAGEKVVRQVRVQIMDKAKTVDLASFDNPVFYEKLENANREAGNRPISTLQSTFSIISTIIQVISYIVILSKVPGMWWMSAGIVAISIPSAIINFIYRRKNFQYVRSRSSDRRKMNYYSDLLVNKDMVKEIRIFDLSDTFIARYKEVFKQYFKGLKRLIYNETFWMVGVAILSAAVNCVFYAIIAMGVYNGSFEIGDYSKYTGSLTNIATCITTLISTSASIYEGTLFIDNLITFMNEKQTIVPAVSKPERVTHGIPHTVEFRNVCFSYPGTDRMVIKDFTCTFRPGETVVLVGLNGAGKTTLIKLLTRLYDPTEGRILLDGIDLRNYEVSDLYDIFGIIFQDYGKYAVTAKENVYFGDIDTEVDDGKIEESTKMANAEDYIAKLPKGIDTQLMRIFDPTGIELSGGQWQKLAIARAFYRDSDIMILDEPTASLDPMAEQEIFNQFDSLREGKMTIFVSHRLSSAVIATKIIVMKDGMLVEEGTHHELMEARGEYYTLFTTQARRYIEGGREIDPEEVYHDDYAHDDRLAGSDSSMSNHDRRHERPDRNGMNHDRRHEGPDRNRRNEHSESDPQDSFRVTDGDQ
ncbi:MAG: ABC transporter ATP-binding protein [Clostridia bacterium]|nr:ABC transporter ATP-binding protein [Clostridia bacterium]